MIFKISVKDALRDRGPEAQDVDESELKKMVTKRVWTPVHLDSLKTEERMM
jgi:hypothetical protein